MGTGRVRAREWARAHADCAPAQGSAAFGSSDDSPYAVYIRIIKGKPPSMPRKWSPELRDLLTQLLQPDISKRLCTAQAVKRHPWFAGVDWAAVEQRRLRAPWVPEMRNASDTSHFDTKEEDDEEDDEEESGGGEGGREVHI